MFRWLNVFCLFLFSLPHASWLSSDPFWWSPFAFDVNVFIITVQWNIRGLLTWVHCVDCWLLILLTSSDTQFARLNSYRFTLLIVNMLWCATSTSGHPLAHPTRTAWTQTRALMSWSKISGITVGMTSLRSSLAGIASATSKEIWVMIVSVVRMNNMWYFSRCLFRLRVQAIQYHGRITQTHSCALLQVQSLDARCCDSQCNCRVLRSRGVCDRIRDVGRHVKHYSQWLRFYTDPGNIHSMKSWVKPWIVTMLLAS